MHPNLTNSEIKENSDKYDPVVHRLITRWQIWRALRAINPLWELMVSSIPEIRLDLNPIEYRPTRSRCDGEIESSAPLAVIFQHVKGILTGKTCPESSTTLTNLSRPERAEYLLHRRVIEIRDAQLRLRPYIPPRATELLVAHVNRSTGNRILQWMRDGIHAVDDPRNVAILLEASELAAALDAFRLGQRHDTVRDHSAPTAAVPGNVALLAEASWLTHVGTAIRDSALVREVRAATGPKHAQPSPTQSCSIKKLQV